MELMVEVQRLTKHFGPIKAVEDVSFKVGRGEVLGFLGPNGAGKSTTMKVVTCFLSPTSGTAKVCGHDILQHPTQVRAKIGYLPEGAPAYPDMTPAGFLDFIAEMRGFKGPGKKERIDRAVQLVGLEEVLFQPIDTLSKGFKRRVGLAQAILHDPEVLILDEPTDGLDPNQKHEVRSLIRKMAKEKAIILSTHILEEVEAVCTRAIIIARGRKIFDGTPEELEKRSRYHNAVTIAVRGDSREGLQKSLGALPGVKSVSLVDDAPAGTTCLRAFPKNGQSILKEVTELARSKDWQVEEIHSESGRLDEVFRELTTGSSDGGSK